jgi:hypothetical protein
MLAANSVTLSCCGFIFPVKANRLLVRNINLSDPGRTHVWVRELNRPHKTPRRLNTVLPRYELVVLISVTRMLLFLSVSDK